MLEVQKYLWGLGRYEKAHTLADLENEFNIKVKDYPEENLVLLDYCQINSPKTHPIVRECRSLILNRETFDVVSRSFSRFFNFGEAQELYEDFDVSRSFAFEKVDGSLIKIYRNPHNGKFYISTRGTALGEAENSAAGWTFSEKVMEILGLESDHDSFQESMEKIWKEYFGDHSEETGHTIIGELIGPENRIVTPYNIHQFVITGVSTYGGEPTSAPEDLERLAELFSHLFPNGNIRSVKTYSASSFSTDEELYELLHSLDPLDEGFIILDPKSEMKRMKLKSETYVTVHKLRGEGVLTNKKIIHMLLENEHEEFLAYFPEYRPRFDSLEEELETMFANANMRYMEAMVFAQEDQKAFALMVKDLPYSSILFQARKRALDNIKGFWKESPPELIHKIYIQMKGESNV